MANKRSAQGPRGRDLFRAEVSSLLADLGDLTQEAAPPVAAAPDGTEPAVPEGIEATAAPEPEPPAPGEATALALGESAAFAPAEIESMAPEETGTTPPDGAGPPPPPSIEATAGPPRPIADGGALLELEDLPSFSPSYLPPLPPVAGTEARSAGSPVAASAPWPPPPAAEPRPAPGGWPAPVAEAGLGSQEAESPDQGWPEPPDWPLASEPAQAAGPFDRGDSDVDAAAAPAVGEAGVPAAPVLEPDPAQPAASDRAATGAPPEEESGPGWRVRVSPTPATIATLAEIPGWGSEAAAQPEPPTEAVDHRDLMAHAPSLPGPPPEVAGSPTWSLPADPRAVPLGIPATTAAAGVAGGPLRAGLPLLPGGAAAPASSRPWSPAAAMLPVPPLTPPPARPGAGAVPATEPAGPLAPMARTSGMSLPFPVFAGLLFAVLAVIVILIVLDLRR